MKNLELKVNKMMCEGCQTRITNALKRIENVKEVKADYKTGIVNIEYEKELDKNIVVEKIENLGFEVI